MATRHWVPWLLFLAACAEEAPSVVGTWRGLRRPTVPDPSSLPWMTYREDGTWSSGPAPEVDPALTYRTEHGVITLRHNNALFSQFDYVLTDDLLVEGVLRPMGDTEGVVGTWAAFERAIDFERPTEEVSYLMVVRGDGTADFSYDDGTEFSTMSTGNWHLADGYLVYVAGSSEVDFYIQPGALGRRPYERVVDE